MEASMETSLNYEVFQKTSLVNAHMEASIEAFVG
jgi:hypothetical protein